jgi:hypothetical protein
MATEQDIYGLPNGNRFYRADLHIHSYKGSHDVSDQAMTPHNIVATALDEGLDVIAITDHNEISNFRQHWRLPIKPLSSLFPASNFRRLKGICFAICRRSTHSKPFLAV